MSQSCIHRIHPSVRRVACGSCGSSVAIYACNHPERVECVLTPGKGKRRITVQDLGLPICSECPLREPAAVAEETVDEEPPQESCETGLCESWIRDRLTKPHLKGKPTEFFIIRDSFDGFDPHSTSDGPLRN